MWVSAPEVMATHNGTLGKPSPSQRGSDVPHKHTREVEAPSLKPKLSFL